jgi:transcriptional regulator with XRE-family HTH domain
MSIRRYVERLNRAREEQGLSVDGLAVRCGYPTDLVEPLLRSAPIVLSNDMNEKLCQALGLDPDDLWLEYRATGGSN